MMRRIQKEDYIQYMKLINSNMPKKDFDCFIDDLSENHVINVMEINDMLVAAGTILIEKKCTHGGCSMGHIENVVVHDDHQKRGLGKKLIENLVQYADCRGCYRTDLSCTKDLVAFYEKCSFDTGRIVMVYLHNRDC